MSKKTFLTKGGLAQKLTVGPRRIDQMVKAGAPRESDGRYCLELFQAWRATHVRPRAGAESPELRRWKCRRMRAQALQTEIKAKRLKSSLISVDAVAQRARRRYANVQAVLGLLPDTLLGCLPAGIKRKQRQAFRAAAAAMIGDVLNVLSERANGGADLTQEPGPEATQRQ